MAGKVSHPRVVLASASPRRRDLLTLIGIPHEVRPANVDESVLPGESPAAYVERLARDKATALGDHDAVCIGSDTTVVVDGEILAKPESQADAARMLRQLSGRAHMVLTGVAVAWRERVESAVEEVGVTFRGLSDDDIARYIATGEPMDKAGAYGIQGFGATIVTRVDGDYFAVMGLPVNRMVRLFERLGLRYAFGALEASRP
ncbi:MAG: septum formation inhibitor Maf [Gemmatimonadota bacterium]|nr:septum formation inhibitor Maf [Gemmatimonadota bacterium]